MKKPDPQQQRVSGQTRLVAVVLAGTMLLWMAVQVVGSEMGWDPRFVFLFDFAALAAFLWALVVTYQIWRARRDQGRE